MKNILEVNKIVKDYGDFLLDNLSFSIPQGVIMGLIGENGAGKTTTINLILNEISRDGGSITVFGKDNLEHEKEIKNQIGIVFDECLLPDLFSPNEIERFLCKVYSAWEHRAYQDYLTKFSLPADKPIKAYSKGMKVKLGFAIALSHRPRLLILDEATSGLDPIMRDDVLDILLDFVQDETHSVLFSSHITSDLEKVADYITFIHDGKQVFHKSKDDLIYHYGIIRGGAQCYDSVDKAEIIACRKHDYEWEMLVADRDEAKRKYKNCVVDNATIDDIMLLYVKGEQQ